MGTKVDASYDNGNEDDAHSHDHTDAAHGVDLLHPTHPLVRKGVGRKGRGWRKGRRGAEGESKVERNVGNIFDTLLKGEV